MKIQRVDNPPEKARGSWELTLGNRKYYFKTEQEARIGIQLHTHSDSVVTVKDELSPSRTVKGAVQPCF